MAEIPTTHAGDRLRTAQVVFEAVVDLPPPQRAAELERRCAGDAELRSLLERLLANADRGLGKFLDSTVASGALRGLVRVAETPPARIGQYEIIRRIGEGGMGVVYEARQEHPHRTVALKVIRPGFATPALLRRFQFEADVLGQLQHPGIACIYDAGVADGVAYFAMEYIRGPSLSQYVAAQRPTRQAILELVVQICDAVHHAHQQGVIHRDLKPGNILVVDEGAAGPRIEGAEWTTSPAPSAPRPAGRCAPQPKVLDFGVARTIRPDLQQLSLHTEVGQLVGTVPYMSPEQVAGDSRLIDVRSDVYSLGVMLYELLAGRLPLDVRNCALPEAARIIREEEPSRLSSLNAALRGDIDTIVTKALEKDRARRYQSAAELAADIRRCLSDQPIVARPASAMYHLAKFARRHRTLVGGIAATFVTLVLGAAVAVLFAVRERHERSRADAKTVESERLAYRASLTAAAGAMQIGDVDVARRALAEAPQALRGWEWDHLAATADQSIRTLQSQGPTVQAIASSNDGRRIVSMDKGGELGIWNVETAERLRTAQLGESGRWGWALSPDGRILVRSVAPVGVRAEDADSGTLLWRRDIGAGLGIRSFMPDGSAVVIASLSEPVVWFLDPATGQELRRQATDRVYAAVVLNSDGSLAACCRGEFVAIHDVRTWRLLRTLETWFWGFGARPARLFQTDPDAVQLLDAYTADSRPFLLLSGAPYGLADRPDASATLFWFRTGAGLIRDPVADIELARLYASSRLECAAYSADGARLFTGAVDGSIRVWDSAARAAPFIIRSGWQEEVSAASVSPAGTLVVVGGWGVVRAYDTRTGRITWSTSVSRRSLLSAAFSPDGEQIAFGGEKGVLLLMSAAGELRAAAPPLGDSAVLTVEFLADGRHVLAGCMDGSVSLISTEIPAAAASNPERPPAWRAHVSQAVPPAGVRPMGGFEQRGEPITAVAAHPTDRRAAIASGMQITLLDLRAEGAPTILACDATVHALAFSPDGKLLASGEGQNVVVRRLDGVSAAPRVLRDAGAAIRRLAFHPHKPRIVAGCEDGTFQVWDLLTGDHLLTLAPESAAVLAARFSADGASLLGAAVNVPLIAFESRPVGVPARQREDALRARALCMPLFVKLREPNAVIDALGEDQRLPPAVRDATIEYVRMRGEHLNWSNSDAWGVVRAGDRRPEEYARALRQARMACALCPGEPSLLNTLGTALYRVGEFSTAVAALTESDALYVAIGRGEQPANWAISAACRQRLGAADAARADLARARALLARPEFRDDSETHGLVREAAALIEPQ